MYPPSKSLQTIAKALTARFGQSHAEAWLAEQLARTRNPEKLPQLDLASKLTPATQLSGEAGCVSILAERL